MQLSVLDQCTASKGQPQSAAIQESISLAKVCEDVGYERYWVSEHHNSDCIVGTAPEVLMAAIGATTNRIRIGSAGVMLPHYAALKVAEQFRVLEAIAPGRIDLGLGRAPGSDRLTAYALNPSGPQNVDYFPQQILDLQSWVTGQPLADDHPFGQIKAHPQGDTSPQMWMLGSSDYGAQLGAHLGMPYAYAYFFSDGQGVERALEIYRTNFKPSEKFKEPKSTICVWALAADTEEEAWHQYQSREYWKVHQMQGLRPPVVPPEEAGEFRYTNQQNAMRDSMREKAIVGTAEQVAEKLTALGGELDLDEMVIVTWTYAADVKEKSYRLIADAMGLSAP